MQQGKRTKKNLTKNELQPPAHTVKIFGLRGRDWISSYRELDERETHRPDITLHAVVSALKTEGKALQCLKESDLILMHTSGKA